MHAAGISDLSRRERISMVFDLPLLRQRGVTWSVTPNEATARTTLSLVCPDLSPVVVTKSQFYRIFLELILCRERGIGARDAPGSSSRRLCRAAVTGSGRTLQFDRIRFWYLALYALSRTAERKSPYSRGLGSVARSLLFKSILQHIWQSSLAYFRPEKIVSYIISYVRNICNGLDD